MRVRAVANPMIVVVVVLLLFAPPGAATTLDRDPVDAIVAKPTLDAYESIYQTGDPDRDARVQDALQHGAYRWAAVLMAESLAEQRSASMWGFARTQEDPYATYAVAMQDWAVELLEDLAMVWERIGQEERSSGQTTHDLEWFLFAAQFTVLGESSLSRGAQTLAAAGEEEGNFDTPTKRYVVAYPFAQAAVFITVSNGILEDFSPRTGSPAPDSDVLDAIVQQQGGTEAHWLLREEGIIHRFVHHLSIYEESLFNPDATKTDLQESLDLLVGQHLEPLLDRGFSGARPLAVVLDATWWLETGGADDESASQIHGDMTSRMHAAVELARYEADVLAAAMAPQDTGSPEKFGWPWLITGVTTLGLLVVFFTWFSVRRRLSGRIRPSGALAMVLFAALLTGVLSFALLSPAEGAQEPAVPVGEPVKIAAAEKHSWGGSLLLDSNGIIHFAWSECQVAEPICPEGRLELRYRNHDPRNGAWSDPVTLVQVEGQDAYLPHILESHDGLVVVWQQGIQSWSRGQTTTHPAEVWWCRLEEGECTARERISNAEAGVESTAPAIGSDGHLRVAWAQLGASGHGEVVFRKQSSLGWNSPVHFPDGGIGQWQPSLAIDEEDTAHLSWLARPPELFGQAHRVVYYARVDAANTPMDLQYVSQHIVSTHGSVLAFHDGRLHLAYGTEEGLYHRARVDDNWTEAFLISRTGETDGEGDPLKRPVHRPDLAATSTGLVAAWMEPIHPHDGFRLRMAELNDGLWLSPATILDPPHRASFNPRIAVDSAGLAHLTWAGDAPPDDPVLGTFYQAVSLKSVDEAPGPKLTVLTPEEGAWTRSASVELSVDVELHAPLDRDRTQLRVGAEEIPFTVEPGGLTATVPDLPEGIHPVELVVWDQAGNHEEVTWSFGVDRTRPEFTFTIVNAEGDPVEGWSGSPVWVKGMVESDDGAPAHIEVQALRDRGRSVVSLDPEDSRVLWTRVPVEEGLPLPEGLLLEITVRARDEAGNMALGDPVTVGWDVNPPEVEFSVPAWFTSTSIEIPIKDAQESGSPITIEATLGPKDPAGGSDVVTTTSLEAERSGTFGFEVLEDGLYNLSVVGIVDEAGNHQEILPGPWIVGVDTSPPRLHIDREELAGTVRVEAMDDGSGVHVLRILQENQLLAEEYGDGGPQVAVRIESLVGSVTVQAIDLAGNEIMRTLGPDGVLVEIAEEDSTDEGNDRIGTRPPGSTSGTGQEGSSERTVSAVAPISFLLLLVVLVRARRR